MGGWRTTKVLALTFLGASLPWKQALSEEGFGTPEARARAVAEGKGEPFDNDKDMKRVPAKYGQAELHILKCTSGDGDFGQMLLDGSFLFVLDKSCRLSKIRIPDLVEERATYLPQGCRRLDMSSQGLVVALPEAVLILNRETLKLTKRVKLPEFDSFACGSKSSVMVCAHCSDGVFVVDLLAGIAGPKAARKDMENDPVRLELATQGRRGFDGFDHLALAPDGRALYAASGDGICKYKVADKKLKLEKAGLRLPSRDDHLMMSPDRTLVARSLNAEGPRDPLLQGIKMNSTIVFKTTDLEKPLVILDASGPVAFDTAGKRYFLFSQHDGFFTFDSSGGILLRAPDPFSGKLKPKQVLFDPATSTLALSIDHEIRAGVLK